MTGPVPVPSHQPDAPAEVGWRLIGASARGASHVHNGAPNQDAIRWMSRGGAAALAVADGHGAAAHARSAVGSALAVEVAVDQALAAARTGAVPDPRALARTIVGAWRSAVLAHAAGDSPSAVGGQPPFALYGTTLLLALAAAGHLIVIQIGDGDLLVGSGGGLVRPLPDDEGLVGEETYSLCLPDAVEAARTAVLPLAEVGFVMLSTDGLSKSFASEKDFLALAAAWRESAHSEDPDALAARLPAWLSNASERGSGDDITLGLMLAPGEAVGPGKPGDPTRPAAPALPARAALVKAAPVGTGPERTKPHPAHRPPRAAIAAGLLAIAIAGLAALVILLDLPLPFGLGPT